VNGQFWGLDQLTVKEFGHYLMEQIHNILLFALTLRRKYVEIKRADQQFQSQFLL